MERTYSSNYSIVCKTTTADRVRVYIAHKRGWYHLFRIEHHLTPAAALLAAIRAEGGPWWYDMM